MRDRLLNPQNVGALKYANQPLRRRILDGREPRWLRMHPRRQYIVAAVLATPAWVERADLRALACEALRLSQSTGVRHVVDHDVPLCHPDVCGLNVPWNLFV